MEIIVYICCLVCNLVLLLVLRKQKQQLEGFDNRIKYLEAFNIALKNQIKAQGGEIDE